MVSSPVRVPPHLVAALLFLQVLLEASAGRAQITLDGSLGPAVPLGGLDVEIPSDAGFLNGDLLSFSFSEFGVPEGGSATFVPSSGFPGADLVVSRVTGGQESDIRGALRSELGESHFYFLNPWGVFFGPDSSVDVGGSFHLSTADEVRDGMGRTFSARAPTDEVLIAKPEVFGFLGPTAGAISVDGASLGVPEGSTLSLIGGKILISSATLNAPSGRVEIASVASQGQVIPSPPGEPPDLDLSSFSSLGRIKLQGATLDASDLSGIGGGSVLVRGGRLIATGSSITANTAGDVDGAAVGVDLALADEISFTGETSVVTLTEGPGRSGDVRIRAGLIEIDGSMVTTFSAAEGSAGDVTLDARTVEITGGGAVGSSFGPTGDVAVTATEFISISGRNIFEDASRIIASSSEKVGRLFVSTPSLRIDDGATILSSTSGETGGDIEVAVRSLSITNGATISSLALGNAPGGSVTVTAADSATISGVGSDGSSQSGIFSLGCPECGRPGDIVVDTGTFSLTGGASIRNGSDIDARAGNVFVTGRTSISIAGSGISIGARDEIGRVELSTPLLSMDYGFIRTSTIGESSAGGILANVGTLLMNGGAQMISSSELLATGGGGSITINATGPVTIAGTAASGVPVTDFIDETRSGLLSSAPQSGDGGSILINTPDVIDLDRGVVTTSTVDGQGGSIDIGSTAEPLALILQNGSAIETRAEGTGRGGVIEIASQSVFPPLAPRNGGLESFEPYVPADSGARISAAASDPQLSGTVAINTPETDIESQLAALDVAFLETQGIASVCAARASGEAGSFQVARYRGLPASPEDLLLTFDDLEAVEIDVALGSPGADAADEQHGTPSRASAATSALAAGSRALRDGKAALAEEHFASAVEVLGASGDPGLRSDALRALGQAQQAQGHYGEARDTLQAAVAVAQASGDAAREAAALSHLGSTQVAMREPLEAERVLVRGLDVAKKSGDRGLASQLETDLGNEAAAQQEWQQALARYEAASVEAHAAGRTEQEAAALASAARAALEAGELERAKTLLLRAEAPLENVSGLAAVHLGIHLGKSYERLAKLETDAPARTARLRQAHGRLQAAAAGAETLGDARLRSFALGNLGALYESEHRSAEALYLTRQALALAEAAEAPDALYRWHWQEGRILWSQGQAEAALASLRRAIEIIDATRQVSLAHYGSAALRFQRSVAPVYRDYVEALLRSSELVATNRQASQRLLDEARDTMEQSQAAELRDYFRDECLADIEARTFDLDRVLREKSPQTAVVYPIALEERLELLVSLPGGAERFSVPISAQALDDTARRFREALTDRTTRRYEPLGKQLHGWLVAPYEARLREQGIETLVFVPGGSLRTIPLGALYDGERFLLEKYALAVTPGLSLVDPRTLDARSGRFLLAGLSTGGAFAEQEFDVLPKVSEEIGAIRKLFGGEVLLDAGFEGSRFRRAVVEAEPTVVHVASHAYFGSGPDESFLLTHDGAVTFDQLAEMVEPRRYTQAPLELLVLSACQTAAGDERAALGLAGVAIRSGARSALGSLWALSDEAAFEVMTGFYQALEQPQISKAKALQQAQLALLGPDSAYQHPFYWSPFLLISNWL